MAREQGQGLLPGSAGECHLVRASSSWGSQSACVLSSAPASAAAPGREGSRLYIFNVDLFSGAIWRSSRRRVSGSAPQPGPAARRGWEGGATRPPLSLLLPLEGSDRPTPAPQPRWGTAAPAADARGRCGCGAGAGAERARSGAGRGERSALRLLCGWNAPAEPPPYLAPQSRFSGLSLRERGKLRSRGDARGSGGGLSGCWSGRRGPGDAGEGPGGVGAEERGQLRDFRCMLETTRFARDFKTCF